MDFKQSSLLIIPANVIKRNNIFVADGIPVVTVGPPVTKPTIPGNISFQLGNRSCCGHPKWDLMPG